MSGSDRLATAFPSDSSPRRSSDSWQHGRPPRVPGRIRLAPNLSTPDESLKKKMHTRYPMRDMVQSSLAGTLADQLDQSRHCPAGYAHSAQGFARNSPTL